MEHLANVAPQHPTVNPLHCKDFEDQEALKKAKFRGCDKFILMRNPSCPDVPQASLWNKDESYFVPHFFRENIEFYYNFEVRPDDVFVVTFPRSGTTWTQEMVWQICNDLDYETPKREEQETRFPYLEIRSVITQEVELPDNVTILNERKSPRFIKSHLPAPLLPWQVWTVKPKIVYVVRNIKDAAISHYHFARNIQHYPGSLQDFLESFMNSTVMFTPYHSHVFDYWRMRNEENILFLTYEEMKKDHPSVIEKTAKFFGKSFSKDQIQELADYLSFDKFSKNTSVNREETLVLIHDILQKKKPDESFHFVRQGKMGSHREEMPEDFIEKFNNWTLDEIKKAQMDPEIQNILLNT